MFNWENEGFRLGTSFDFVHAIVVAGEDETATALVSLGIARAQLGRRSVAIADLLGDSPALQRLVEDDDPHGLSDSFTYGVSLNRIARPAAGSPGLFVLPTGSEPLDYDEVLPSERWARLAAGFRQVDSLLVLAVPAGAPGIERLVAHTDGAVLVGAPQIVGLPNAAVLARVADEEAVVGSVPFDRIAVRRPPSSRKPAAIAGIGITAALVALFLWLAARPFDRSFGRPVTGQDTLATARVLSAPEPVLAAESGTGDLLPANPADSAESAAFSIELKRANTQAGAILLLEEESRGLPAATFTPEMVAGSEWFTILGGAYADSAEADSLLRHLRQRGQLDPVSGAVSRRPLAFVLHGAVRAEAAKTLAVDQRRRGIPAYALRQADGTAVVYAGAFSSPENAVRFAAILRSAGIAPTLVYRTGRVY